MDILCFILESLIRAFQKCEMNSLSQSVMGQPFSQNHQLKKMAVSFLAVGMLVLHTASWISAPTLSVIVTML